MPKKSTTARGGAQRAKTKTQKSFELVRPVVETQQQEPEPEAQHETAMATASVSKATTPTTPTTLTTKAAPLVVPAKPAEESITGTSATPKATASSTSSRPAARRQAAQTRLRTATPLVTAEHYGYVRKDLMFIAILAIIMFAAIIILHFTLA